MTYIPNVDWGSHWRRDVYVCKLVDPFTLVTTGEVDIDAGSSSITYALDTDTKSTASIAVLDDLAKDSMIRIVHTITVGGEEYVEEMGTFFAQSKSMDAESGRVSRDMECYSTLLRHKNDYLMSVHNYMPGDNVSEIIREIVEADGGHLVTGPGAPTDRVHTQDMHWQIGTNKLEMITSLAGWIGGEIGVTDHGEVELSIASDPYMIEPAYTFEEGEKSVYLKGVTTSEDEGDVYNRAVYYYSTDSGSASATAVLDKTHPYSYERIGRNETYVEELNEETTQEELLSMATSFLNSHSGGSVYYTIEHAGVPWLRPGMKVRYKNPYDYTGGIDSLCVISEMSVDSLSPMCMTKTKMRALT